MSDNFSVVIAGRPNVGKSTLFNRLIGKSMALIDNQPGVTRDWRDGDAKLFDLRFKLYDTAGLEDVRKKGSIPERMAQQTNAALTRADVILMMVDGQVGLTDDDKFIAREIRKTGRPIVLLVNKCEGPKMPDGFHDALSLGFEHSLAVSSLHGENMDDIYDALLEYAPDYAKVPDDEDDDEPYNRLHIAITGRPNAGKSTLANQYIGEERMMTGPEPGLTRDSIHINFDYDGHPIRLVDTAGIRRRARIDEKLEKMSVQEALRAIRLAHVVILMMDADKPFDKQDYTIAQHVAQEGRCLVIAINKWDECKHKAEVIKMIHAKISASLAQLSGVKVVPISALKNDGLDKLMEAVFEAHEIWNRRVSTSQLNRWFEGMVSSHPPPISGNGRIKMRYITQMKGRPPTFGLWGTKLRNLPESYVRFLTNGLRKTFDFQGVPIRWHLKTAENPFEPTKKKRTGKPRKRK